VATKSDYYTHCQDIPPQYGPGVGNAKSAPIAAHIDGKNGKAWTLPLPPLTGTSTPEPYYVPAASVSVAASAGSSLAAGVVDEEAARHEAAVRIMGNRDALLRFCCRGAGATGWKQFQAPLADPYATPTEDPAVRAGADLLLRCTVARLLATGDESASAVAALEEALGGCVSAGKVAAGVRSSGNYLRDRIGVPRDMSFPAARQLRAHLNWAAGALQK